MVGDEKFTDSILQMSIQNLVSAIETTNERIEKTNDRIEKTNNKVDKITEMISKQEVLFEKLVGIEGNIAQAFKHVHSRINEQHQSIEKIEDVIASGKCPGLIRMEEKHAIEKEHMEKDETTRKEEIKSIKIALKDLQEKPGKRWDSMITFITSGLIASLISYISIHLGFKG